MGTEDTAGVLDRTPIDFRSGCHFPRKSDRPVGVRTIGAIDFLNDVQIGKMMSIENQIFAARELSGILYMGKQIAW